MKTIGLLGGMSWESTVTYYQLINEAVKEKLGGLHSAKIVLHSVDFDEIEKCQSSGDWARSGEILGQAAAGLERAGADFILICTNTMHKVAGDVQAHISVPLLHIGEVTARALLARGIHKAALLGTRYTMEQDFYKDKLASAGIEVLIPDAGDRAELNRIIFDELCVGKILPKSREKFKAVTEALAAQGAQAAILGCTEIGLLLKPEDTRVPLFDTTVLHAAAAVELALTRHTDLPKLELLVAGHHGSRYSTSDDLLDALTPETALISVGSNSYGHPAEDTLRRLAERECTVYRTDLHGTIHLSIWQGDTYENQE